MKSVVTIAILCLVKLSPSRSQDTTSSTTEDDLDSDFGEPWETPFQELVRIAPACMKAKDGFDKVVWKAEVEWQKCMDAINPHIPELDVRNANGDEVNATVYHEIEKKVNMAICVNTTAFKSCWTGIIAALNDCRPGAGNVSARLYYALYDDICRDGGKITTESRRLAETQGRLCDRDYATKDCKMNRRLQSQDEFYDLCTRFQSNVLCDLSSIDPNCKNTVDKNSHSEIFERVGMQLKCTDPSQSMGSSCFATFATTIFWSLAFTAIRIGSLM